MFNYQLTQAQMTNQVQQVLVSLRNAITAAQNLYAWTSGLAVSDLEAVGYSAADAQSILSAAADASALAQLYTTGLPPASYPQPQAAYVYGESQRQVIGPQ